MPRPKVDRGARSLRLPAELDAQLLAYAQSHGLSVNAVCEQAIRAHLTGKPTKTQAKPAPLARTTVTPRFKNDR